MRKHLKFLKRISKILLIICLPLNIFAYTFEPEEKKFIYTGLIETNRLFTEYIKENIDFPVDKYLQEEKELKNKKLLAGITYGRFDNFLFNFAFEQKTEDFILLLLFNREKISSFSVDKIEIKNSSRGKDELETSFTFYPVEDGETTFKLNYLCNTTGLMQNSIFDIQNRKKISFKVSVDYSFSFKSLLLAEVNYAETKNQFESSTNLFLSELSLFTTSIEYRRIWSEINSLSLIVKGKQYSLETPLQKKFNNNSQILLNDTMAIFRDLSFIITFGINYNKIYRSDVIAGFQINYGSNFVDTIFRIEQKPEAPDYDLKPFFDNFVIVKTNLPVCINKRVKLELKVKKLKNFYPYLSTEYSILDKYTIYSYDYSSQLYGFSCKNLNLLKLEFGVFFNVYLFKNRIRYLYLNSEPLIYFPQHQLEFYLSMKTKFLNLQFICKYSSKRKFERESLPEYLNLWVINSYKLAKNLDLFIELKDYYSKRYRILPGYYIPQNLYRAGIRILF